MTNDRLRLQLLGFRPRTHRVGSSHRGSNSKPNNTMPFKSQAQAGYMHTHPEVLGKKGLAEWDQATKGKKLPKRIGATPTPEPGKGSDKQPSGINLKSLVRRSS